MTKEQMLSKLEEYDDPWKDGDAHLYGCPEIKLKSVEIQRKNKDKNLHKTLKISKFNN